MNDSTTNPILKGITTELPLFDQIRPEHVLPAIDAELDRARQVVTGLTDISNPDWDSLMLPLEQIEESLGRVWGPVGHLNAVCDSEELRPIYQQGVAKMTEWSSELAQNEALYAAIRKVADRDDFPSLSQERRQVIEHALRDFKLSGAELEGDAKARFKAIQMKLSELTTAFGQHVLDATQAFELHITEAADVAGLPESILASAAQRAAQSDREGGWLITLDAPSYVPFMQFAEKRELRETMYRQYVTRASSGELDNTPVIVEILALRAEAASLLDFEHYAASSLASKMATDVDEVTGFLRELAAKSRPIAEQEFAELQTFAAAELGLDDLQAWDVAYAAERLRLKTYAISQEELKPYFPEKSVVNGMFGLVEKLYGISIRENENVPKWHASVRYFELFDSSGEQIAAFYLDPYARAHKRGGAWMDECIVRWRKPDGSLQLPVAYLVCNFDAPVGDRPALWTHDEVTTLFHEFGHGLHHMLTSVSELGVSGIRGVPWDAVELPSQFMENFCWERQVVELFAKHYESGETLPEALFDKMLAAKNFQSAMIMLRQIEFALFDVLLHSEYDPAGSESVQQLLDRVRSEVSVISPPAFNRFQNSFSHIFAGGYAAGYYSYKWAEVLSADVYATFEEEGVLNAETAGRLRKELLSIGGSKEIMDAFVAFRGRKPSVDALLRHSGLAGNEGE
ncbi:M3 family metallopeptidase [Mariprofundus sp. NF]|uniref:M3 family metallopeptidase n=1 Tax=Mariprofundus sp. NF TaxID=2608716 RepID=UPI0015A1B788|nr:M3 family metallopeptidase [Mariprofundus sp. NF]NWF38397.1 M3 family metallopeptidase [Mariprofundus sp. NF]